MLNTYTIHEPLAGVVGGIGVVGVAGVIGGSRGSSGTVPGTDDRTTFWPIPSAGSLQT